MKSLRKSLGRFLGRSLRRSLRFCTLLLAAATTLPASAHLKMPKEPASPLVKRSANSPAGTIYYWGYSHIDFNWLWDWADTVHTWDGTARTALNLMYRFPDYHFTETQAAGYMSMERIRPDLFESIKSRIASGQWHIEGGMWDESDTNLPSGEALARSFLYGQGYFQEKFGKQARSGFLPDSFGHTRQLPQILQQAEIPYFYFQRCPLPNRHLFWWQAPDGSRVLAYSSPGWYNDRIDPAAQTNYPATILAESGVNIAGVCFGVGNHGGGPTITDLTTIEMLKTDPSFPEVRTGGPEDFFDAVKAAEPAAGFPSWNSDLQYTFEGCYTTQSTMKKNLRDGENTMYTAEVMASLASLYGLSYPENDLRYGWRTNAFNQFHDIAPGTGIHSTYEEVANKVKAVKQTAQKIQDASWATLEKRVETTGTGQALVLFNPLAWSRTDPVEATLPFPTGTAYVQVTDPQGNSLPAQVIASENRDGKTFLSFVFVAQDVPSMGYRVYHVSAAAAGPVLTDPLTVNQTSGVVTTPTQTVTVDKTTGQVSRITDKATSHDFLASGQKALRFAVQRESGENAWVIGLTGSPTYLDTPTSFKILETGPVRAHFQAVYQNGSSTYAQDIFVYRGTPRIDARISVNFQDAHLFVKSVIPTSTTNPTATFDGPFYAMARPADGRTDVPLQKWLDVSDSAGYGLSVLNDCKYGADVNGGTIRMSLLRDPRDPDGMGESGLRNMTLALWPHAGDWKAAGTMRHGYELNVPMLAIPADAHAGEWGTEKSFLGSNLNNVAVTAFKRAEDGDGYILRYYDYTGAAQPGTFTLPMTVTYSTPVNILEHTVTGTTVSSFGNNVNVSTRPYAIQSVRVRF